MFHPLQLLFKRPLVTWEETDLIFFIERYLRTELHTEALYCDKVQHGVAVVRVSSAALQQAATLLEFELQEVLETETSYRLKQLRVYVG